ncbi:MAG TPA: HD domain-containing protein [Candidatus Moranbacteria bacterium]|nr:HD domain-containing protein [Candidatus Moranbacteria bacterium]HDZ85290.1 HD domain-containing protein [Candidatus Moranbacteria bacterium]
MKINKDVLDEIKEGEPSGNLAHTAKIMMVLLVYLLPEFKEHSEKVALFAKKVAEKMGIKGKIPFYVGLFHDVGKIPLNHDLFDDHEFTKEDYAEVKKHAMLGFNFFKDIHLFIAVCVGLVHNVYDGGYGITMDDFPHNFGDRTVKKMKKIAAIVSVCDFTDSFLTRGTKLKDAASKGKTLSGILREKYHKYPHVVKAALEVKEDLELY